MKIFLESPLSELSTGERRALLERQSETPADVRDTVADILRKVRDSGDRALYALARELDGVELESLEVPLAQCREAVGRLPTDLLQAMERARDNIARFHLAQLERLSPLALEVEPGVRLERRTAPLSSAGVYAPGGRAAYPSSVLMGVVPAVVAGVPDVVVCSPPGPGGVPSPPVLAAAALAGATRVFALGGAGAVGAMAFGTATVPAVGAIVGPGNAWVAEAKRQVAGSVRIDSPAGPSELLVVADETADPVLVARELVAQAEHDPEAVVGLISPSSETLARTRAALDDVAVNAVRSKIVMEALARRGFLILTSSMAEALAFADDFAAEHLSIVTSDPEAHVEAIRTAGTIFLGLDSSVAFGDYMTGANHVLPTGGAARWYSGLSVEHFVRTYTVQTVTSDGAAALSRPVATLANSEGLPAHAAAVAARERS